MITLFGIYILITLAALVFMALLVETSEPFDFWKDDDDYEV